MISTNWTELRRKVPLREAIRGVCLSDRAMDSLIGEWRMVPCMRLGGLR
jgi:hypothetical protein